MGHVVHGGYHFEQRGRRGSGRGHSNLPETVDLVLIVDIKPGARVAIIDFKPDSPDPKVRIGVSPFSPGCIIVNGDRHASTHF